MSIPRTLQSPLKLAHEMQQQLASSPRGLRLAPNEAKAYKAAARKAIAAFAKLDRAGKPKDPIDAQIVARIEGKRDAVVRQVRKASARRSASPQDYYEIYWSVLKDSGLARLGMPAPAVVRRMARLARMRGQGGHYCHGCALCELCAVCVICEVSGVVGIVGTGAVGGIAGLFA